MSNHSIYISHAWGGESEVIVQEIYKRCRKSGLNILLDKKDLGYRESISSFMKSLGQADAIILVVSNKYLHSEYCMYELLQIYENKNMISRIFPVVLDEVSIAKSTERLELVKYWENETENLETKIRELKNLSYIEGITDDLNLYQKIRNNIANMTRILKDINTLNIKLHKDSDYNHLISAVEKYVRESDSSANENHPGNVTEKSTGPRRGSVHVPGGKGSDQNVNQTKDSSPKKWWSGLFGMWPLMLIAVLIPTGVYFWSEYDTVADAIDSADSSQPTESSPEQERTGLAEISAQNPGSQVVFKTDNSRPSATLPDTDTAIKNKRETSGIGTSNKPIAVVEDKEAKSKKRTSPESFLTIGEDEEQRDSQSFATPVSTDDASNKKTENDNSTKPDVVPDAKPDFRMEEVYVNSSTIAVRLPQDLSSNKVNEGELVYLRTQNPLVSGGVTISGVNARVKTRVIDAKASHQGGRGALGIRLEGLETVDGQWLDISYHDIVERKRGEIVFEKGTILSDVGIKPTSIQLKIIQ